MKLFIAAITLMAGTSIWRAYRHHGGPWAYLKTDEGRKVGAGWLAFVGAALLLVGISQLIEKARADEIRYLQFAEVFVGLDYTKNLSPQCEPNPYDEKATSNGGVRLNLAEMDNGYLNLQYTHHSCAFGPDDRSYDALGLQAVYRFNF